MKKILLISFIIFIQSCIPKVIPLKGKYQEGPVVSKIDRPLSKVWESIIDLIAETGMSIKMIDKSSGLILSEDADFYGTMSHEDNKGNLLDSKAYIASERMDSEFPQRDLIFYNSDVKWTARAKEIKEGVTTVSLVLHINRVTNILEKQTGRPSYRKAKSTGNFEKWFLDEVITRSEK